MNFGEAVFENPKEFISKLLPAKQKSCLLMLKELSNNNKELKKLLDQSKEIQEKLKLDALEEVLTLRVIDRVREELGSAYSPGVESRFSKLPVGEYALRLSIGCTVADMPKIERVVDEIIKALQENGPTAGELEKVTRTWLNEHEARTKTNGYWAGRLRVRLLDPELDEDGPEYVARVKALAVADVQEAARTFTSGANVARLALEPEGSR